MILFIFLALLNGMLIGSSRAINGQLSAKIGPFKASLWNHIIGFIFLTLILIVMGQWQVDNPADIPFSAYLGGFFGALFVAVSSYVFPRLGAMNAAILVISGQMISAVFIDWQNTDSLPSLLRCLGVIVVLLGIYLSRLPNISKNKEITND
ncbi:DMT family transporter [Zooshikella ganghwensis]|uniref:DMT family transporter n=1 Tax=Zooshikella ganghwensis TaxID=202772 RepID=UPI0004006645|nr:DMT family transporter [Zooshikella ganghwensis]